MSEQTLPAPQAEVKLPTAAAAEGEETKDESPETCTPSSPLASSDDDADADDADATSRGVRLSDDELLMKHYPRYFYDKQERYFPIDLNKYTLDKSVVPGCNGVATPSKDGKRTWLIYMSYFQQDGGVPQLGGKGSHKHDLEVVIVELSPRQKVRGVFYGPHGGHEHMWIRDKADLKEILKEGRPRVFVSRGKHASYPVSGRVLRLFGFGTDLCEKPTKRDRPLFILDKRTRKVKLIDEEFSGPKDKISRDWSVAGTTRLEKIRTRRAVPPKNQIRKELSKLAFWK